MYQPKQFKPGYQIKTVKEQIFNFPHLLIAIFYLLCLNNVEKVLIFIAASIFSMMEHFFTGGYTTIGQWFVHVLFVPIVLMWPIQYLSNPIGNVTCYLNFDHNVYMLIFIYLAFPFLCWILEVAEGVWLEFWHDGDNPCWFYDTPEGRIGGKIRFDYWKYWLLIALCYFAFFFITRL